MEAEQQGSVYQEAMEEMLTIDPHSLETPFLSSSGEGLSFKMRKRSGGRYREACCKMGAIFTGWKER